MKGRLRRVETQKSVEHLVLALFYRCWQGIREVLLEEDLFLWLVDLMVGIG